jgi:hypothetical protein
MNYQEEDAFNRFYKSFQNLEGKFHILEHRVPVEQQMDYFKFSDKIKKEVPYIDDLGVDEALLRLKSHDSTIDEKKRILSVLAVSKQVKAYRILENYVRNPEKELVNWAYMALMESRITLESELSDEQHVYISTGLGGKDGKLRFYVLILSLDGLSFVDYQHKIIEKEFTYTLEKDGCVIERLTIGDRFVEMVFLVPVKSNVKQLLENIIRECNVYGNFLSEIYTITNVKELERVDVDRIVEQYGNSQTIV